MGYYKKKYESLIEAIKQLQKANPSDEGIQNWVNDNVPELKVGEDEKIRKILISYFSAVKGFSTLEYNYGITNEDAVAWLEKQGEQKLIDKEESKMQDYITPNQKFFQWIYDRLVYVHNENPNVDYMLSLKERIKDM